MTGVEDLLEDLEKAVELASQFSGGYSDHHFSAEEFHTNLVKKLGMLRNGDIGVLGELMLWFTPSYDWDDFVGEEGMPLANRIHSKLTKLRDTGFIE